ncbi:MAG: sigma-70 family RNA polymerase sigma factor [Planctomycetes bacterium]|nr:sigma-70 family RNA polymerase sigma factor [Planctomycetota bacterium]
MSLSPPDTNELLRRATAGDASAETALLVRHRDRLRHMVSIRFDERIAARVDPSDVVQDVLAKAARDLPGYLQSRPLPFYPWLRQMAWERLIQVHRRHIAVQSRSVLRERPLLSDASAQQLVAHLVDKSASPDDQVEREETHQRLKAALAELPVRDCEIVIMRFLEQLSTSEVAVILGMSVRNVQVRQLHALRRLRRLLGAESGEGRP